jgi:hypothetical protein
MRKAVATEFANSVNCLEPQKNDFAQPATSMSLYRPDDRVFIQRCDELNKYFICSSLEASILGGIKGLI